MKKLIKVLSLTALMMWMSGCEVRNLDTPKSAKPKIDDNLPIISKSSIRSIPSITQIALEWKGTTQANTLGYYIYRSDLQKDGEELSRVATIKNRYASHYLNTNLKPETRYLYAISIIGKDGTESRPSQSVAINTLPIYDSVSLITVKSDLPRQVRIEWRPHTNYAVSKYIIERSSINHIEWEKIATVKGRLNPEYIDIKLKDDIIYSYRLKAVTHDGIESKYSKVVKATTKSLPRAVKNIEATNDQPRKIIVTWEPLIQKDIVGYNLYSSSSSDGSFSKIETASKDANTFEDVIKKDNKKRFYKITTVDKDDLETDIKLLPVVMGVTLSAPVQPTVKLALIKGEEVVLNWEKGDDRTVGYNIYKTTKEGFFKTRTKIFKNIQDVRYVDSDIIRGFDYTYEIEAFDENGLISPKAHMASLKMERVKKSVQKEEK
ncbi:MAG: fibronectin type III domain-containing protein [Arcobacteraceae bacterium]|nr:fibronectin type III domain-containing protein [Arcobacteraceae bacterium]